MILNKHYCYKPTASSKDDMRRGIGASYRGDVKNIAEMERPELNRHYEAAKRGWKGEMDFCTECEDPRCAINRYEIQREGLEI